MLLLHDGKNAPLATPDLAATVLPAGAVWVDLINADAAEIAYVERATDLHVPSFDELSEIENSSRLRFLRGALCMSVPLIAHAQQNMPTVTPVGLILARDVLVTVRFAELNGFKAFATDFDAGYEPVASAAGVFVGLMEALIDRAADILEALGAELDQASQAIFRNNHAQQNLPLRTRDGLRATLRRIGRSGDLLAKMRDTLLGLGRIAAYAENIAADSFQGDLLARLKAERQDILSLNDYSAQLSNKVQLLLDATLGFINIEQNNSINVLTVVSVVGVPPTLVASIYGMNFRHMPELEWGAGYPFGLAVIVISALLPLWWFKKRGWV